MDKINVLEVLVGQTTVLVRDLIDKYSNKIQIEKNGKTVIQECAIRTPIPCFGGKPKVTWVITNNNKILSKDCNIKFV